MSSPAPGSLAGIVADQSRRRAFGRFVGWLVDLPLAGRWIARLTRAPITVRFASTRLTRHHARLLRLSHGRLRRSWMFAAGQPVLALTTVGRRSRRPQTTAVACFTEGDDLILAGMNLGISRDPQWALNLRANPEAMIELAGMRIPVTARRADGDEAAALWRRWVALQPSARAFRELAGRDIPLFVLTRR